MSDYASTPHEIGWDDEIIDDGGGFHLLEDGDYNFTIVSTERGRFPGGAKIPACNKMILTLNVDDEGKTSTVKYDLIMWTSLHWKITDVFCAVGLVTRDQAKKGYAPPWPQLVGSTGRARFIVEEYTKKDGTTGQSNKVDKFYDYDPAFDQQSISGMGGGASKESTPWEDVF